MTAILNTDILNLAILDSAILVFPLKLFHTCQDWFPPLAQTKLNSFILAQLDDDSHLEYWHLEFGHLPFSHLNISSQTHSHLPRLVPTICTKKPSLIQSHLTWWWQPSWIPAIFNLAILDSAILVFSFKLTNTCQDWFPPFAQKISIINSDSTWWWQPSWILTCWIETLPSWIETPCYLLSDSLNNTLTPLWFWLKLIQFDSNSFSLT